MIEAAGAIGAILLVYKFSLPIGLAALGETIGQKSGVLNIGIEGVILISAYVAVAVTDATGSLMMGMLCGVGAGLIVGLIQTLAMVVLNADQVVVGMGVNLAALGATSAHFRYRYGQSGQLISLPDLPTVFGIDAMMFALPVLMVGAGILLYKTKWGLAVRAAGEDPDSVFAAGFNVVSLRFTAAMLGALGAALAGSYLALGLAGSFAENMSGGRGFVAIAIVTFGRWRPGLVVIGAILIGFLETLQFALQARGVAVSPQLLLALPYVVALLIVALLGRSAHAPASLARPLERRA